ncbi:hypothetical protein AXW67_38915 [Bradyrhizobium neotropicale]|uniref:Uncharacterized protein n=2 Tax=Bradyrhizobium neotropicale TaxID=1497615 RepID=A0A176ZEA1_9BRAD|nr:hypothetical protein AXW67_38915 [Bradyrhizobium neotropicale]
MLSELIGDIYDAALDPTLWLRALEHSCIVGGSSAVLYWHDVASESSAALHLFNDDPHYTQLYFEKYMPMNPVFPAATFIESGLIYTPTDIVPEAELRDTRFHKEWVEPQGITDVVCVNLEKATTSSSVLNIRRDGTHGIVDDAVRQRDADRAAFSARGRDRPVVRSAQDGAGGPHRNSRQCRGRHLPAGAERPATG